MTQATEHTPRDTTWVQYGSLSPPDQNPLLVVPGAMVEQRTKAWGYMVLAFRCLAVGIVDFVFRANRPNVDRCIAELWDVLRENGAFQHESFEVGTLHFRTILDFKAQPTLVEHDTLVEVSCIIRREQ